MRGPGAAIATLILMLAIAAGAFALPKDAELGRMAADGPVTLSSSRAGVALLHGEGIMPGDSVTGLITLSNKGDKPGKLALIAERPARPPRPLRRPPLERPAPAHRRPHDRRRAGRDDARAHHAAACSPTSRAARPAPTR